MKKNIIFLLTLFLLSGSFYSASAQLTPVDPSENEDDDRTDAKGQAGNNTFWDKVVIGGNLGAGFGTTTYIDVSPIIGYKLTPKLLGGVGFTYQYLSYRDPYGYFAPYKATVAGPRVFSEYDIFYGVFAHVEYEHLWVTITPEGSDSYKDQVPGLFPGLGYKANLGGRANLKIMVLYDVLWDSSNILYGSPWQIRLGFTFGG